MKIKRRKKKKNPVQQKNKIKRRGRGRIPVDDLDAAQQLKDRRRESLNLRMSGMSYYRIGQQMGTSMGIAYQDVKVMLKKEKIDDQKQVEKLRQLELMRLDRLLELVKPVLKSKDYYERMAALDKALKIMDRRAKYIPGMDAPVSGQVGVDDSLRGVIEQATTEVNQILKRLAGEEE